MNFKTCSQFIARIFLATFFYYETMKVISQHLMVNIPPFIFVGVSARFTHSLCQRSSVLLLAVYNVHVNIFALNTKFVVNDCQRISEND